MYYLSQKFAPNQVSIKFYENITYLHYLYVVNL